MHYIKYMWYPNNEIRAIHYCKPTRKIPARPVLLWTQFILLGTACSGEFPAEGEKEPLDISSDFTQTDPLNLGHKMTTFGSDAKNTILRMGGALDTICDSPSHYVFLTGTLPASTHAAYRAMAVHAGFMVKTLNDWVSRTIKSEYWFYVWELQTRGALHLHYCAYVPNATLRANLIADFPKKWAAIIDSVGERESIDMWERFDGTTHARNKSVLQAYAQEVRSSVAAYMAKYCSKGTGMDDIPAQCQYYPKRWWGASRSLTNLTRRLTQEVLVAHTNYRDARTELDQHRERVKHDTDIRHSYPHKVGPGATVISYHPQDKGKQIWQEIEKMKFNKTTHPNVCSWIAALERYIHIWLNYYKALKPLKGEPYLRLLGDVEAILSTSSLPRCTLHQRDLRVILRTTSVLSLNTLVKHAPECQHHEFIQPIWMYHQIVHLLRWSPQGWLVLENDFPVRLTDCWSQAILGTSSIEQAVEGDIALGSSSPSYSQLELW